MTTETIKFNIYPKKRAVVINNSDLRRRVFNVMLFCSAFLILCYLLLLSNMVWNILARKSIESETRILSNNVNSLELQYLSLSKNIDLNLAYSMGFKETSEKEFTTRDAFGSLPLRQNDL